MVAICTTVCVVGGCSRVEHQRMGTSSPARRSSVQLLVGVERGLGSGVRGGDTLLGFEAARASSGPVLRGGAWGVCGWSSLLHGRSDGRCVGVWGCSLRTA